MSDTPTEDPLARTATAPGAAHGPAAPPLAPGDTLGRYRLERELGAGGMGVVYAAYDADLERRIALKVLRSSADAEARGRLLREARAMARLTHGNVVVVHEVGSASGRDYVAMELVDGETLADWLRAEPHEPPAVVAAFVAAGRGLAAAHAAGLVHRDFKPHNVLRARDGRILVTDFGLARGIDAPVDAMSATQAIPLANGSGPPRDPDASMSGLTLAGSVLGTPAYMAPEQWRGGTIGPATDQFAFCVAMWEALAGARPFRGTTLEALRGEVERGTAALDASPLPRGLRAPLRRGLDPDPRRRWPSMSSLLARIDPSARDDRRAVVALGAAAGAVIALGAALLVTHHAGAGPACTTKGDPDAAWPAGAGSAIAAAGQRPAADALDADFQNWTAARDAACNVDEPEVRAARLTCLDGVLARFDAVARGVEQLRLAPPAMQQHVDPGELLVDPAVCERGRTPRLALTSSAEVREAIAMELRVQATAGPPDRAAVAALALRATNDPCATAIAQHLAYTTSIATAERRDHLDAATEAAERCGDDRVIADVKLANAGFAMSGTWLGDELVHRLGLAETAVQAVAQPDLSAELEAIRMSIAARTMSLDVAIQRGTSAAAGFAARGRVAEQLAVELQIRELERQRGHADDLAAMTSRLQDMRARAASKLGADDQLVRRIDTELGNWKFWSGDVAGAHVLFSSAARQLPNDQPHRTSGRVVDTAGAPVAGATVYVGAELQGDALAAAMPDDHLRTVITDADGRFAVADAAQDAIAVAELADRRSRAAVAAGDDVELVLEPTSRIEGVVDLHGLASQSVYVAARDTEISPLARYNTIAPVGPDGRFTLDGVPRHSMRVSANLVSTFGTGRFIAFAKIVKVDAPVVTGVDLAIDDSKRVAYVLVRSTVGAPVANAQVVVLPGVQASMSALALTRTIQTATSALAQGITAERAPPVVLKAAHAGDLYATIAGVPEGAATACALSLPSSLDDPELWRKVQAHLDKIEVRCQPLAPSDEAVVVEVPPWPRLD